MCKKPLIVIGGPTACGKTDMSIKVAQKINGEIISGDSMQVYKYMDIGTAKITIKEMANIKHYMIDELYPDDEFNVMIFQKMAKKYIQKIYSNNKIPIVVGGTGFYINALVYDNNFMETDNKYDYRNYLYELSKTDGGVEKLYNMLKDIDPNYVKIVHANNIKRVIRALEFFHLTGKRMSEHNIEEKTKVSPYNTSFVILTMDRNELYDRINKRIDIMIEKGLIDEVKNLVKMGYSKDLVSMQAIGYKEIIPYINKEISFNCAIENLKKNTRHFAKRQLTWFRRQTNGLWINLSEISKDKAVYNIIEYLKELKIL